MTLEEAFYRAQIVASVGVIVSVVGGLGRNAGPTIAMSTQRAARHVLDDSGRRRSDPLSVNRPSSPQALEERWVVKAELTIPRSPACMICDAKRSGG